MKAFFITTLFNFVLLSGQAQITKYNWLVGGSANFSSSTENLNNNNEKINSTTLAILPNIGYFIVDKFAVGISSGVSLIQAKSNNVKSNVTSYKIGPFARYYFLEAEKTSNLFLQASFSYGINRFKNFSNNVVKNKNYSYLISGGPVVYFNTSVGLEFTAGWNYEKRIEDNSNSSSFLLGIGLQIHLEK